MKRRIRDGAADFADARKAWEQASKGRVTLHGAHVFIGEDGTIEKGPAHLVGLKPKAVVANVKAALDVVINAHPALADVGIKKSTGTKLNNAQYAYVKNQVTEKGLEPAEAVNKLLTTPATHTVQTSTEVANLVDARHPATPEPIVAPPIAPEAKPSVPMVGQQAKDAIAAAIDKASALDNVALKQSTGTKLNNAQYSYIKQQVAAGVHPEDALQKMLTTPDTHKALTAAAISDLVNARHDGDAFLSHPEADDGIDFDAPHFSTSTDAAFTAMDNHGLPLSHGEAIAAAAHANGMSVGEQIEHEGSQPLSQAELNNAMTFYHTYTGPIGTGNIADVIASSVGLDQVNPKITAALDSFKESQAASTPSAGKFVPQDSWTQLSGPKGSNPGGIFADDKGNQQYVKFYPKDDQAKNEVLANSIYRTLGINAPESRLVSINGQNGVASQMIAKAAPMSAAQMAMHSDVINGFVADAFLANHDVTGTGADNIVTAPHPLTGAASAIRIDNGGAMFFRAQGGDKPSFIDSNVDELATMRNPKNLAGAVFKDVTTTQMIPQAQALVDTLTNAKISELVTKAGFTGAAADKYVTVLQGRRGALADVLGITKSDTKGEEPKTVQAKPPANTVTSPSGVSAPEPMSNYKAGKQVDAAITAHPDGATLDSKQVAFVKAQVAKGEADAKTGVAAFAKYNVEKQAEADSKVAQAKSAEAVVDKAIADHPVLKGASLTAPQKEYIQSQVTQGVDAKVAIDKMLATKYTKMATTAAEIDNKVNGTPMPKDQPSAATNKAATVEGMLSDWTGSSQSNGGLKLKNIANILNDKDVSADHHSDSVNQAKNIKPSEAEIADYKAFEAHTQAYWAKQYPNGRTQYRGTGGQEAFMVKNAKVGDILKFQPLMSTTSSNSPGFGSTKAAFEDVKSDRVFATHETKTATVGFGYELETVIYGNKGQGWQYLGKNSYGQHRFKAVP